MPTYSHAFLLAVCEHLKSKGRPNTLPYAIRWVKRLTRPLYQGPAV